MRQTWSASNVVDIGLVLGEVLRAGKPFDGCLEAITDAVFRLKTSQLADLGVVAPEAKDFGLARTDALLVGKELNIAIHQFADEVERVPDGNLVVGTDIHSLANRLIATRQGQETTAGISHIVEIASGSNVTQLDLLHTIGDLADDRRDNCAGRLTRPVSIERPCDGKRQIEGVEEAHRHCVGADLGRAVGGLRLERMLFVDRNVLRRTVDFTG